MYYLRNWDVSDERFDAVIKKGLTFIQGAQGKGKDVLCQHYLNLHRQPHYANMPYDYLDMCFTRRGGHAPTELITTADLALGDNTFKDYVQGTMRPCTTAFRAYSTIVISDGGSGLSAHHDAELKEMYPYLDCFIPFVRQQELTMLLNAQNYERVLKLVREQSDGCINCLGCENNGDYLTLSAIWYEKYQSAIAGVSPTKSSIRWGEIVKFAVDIRIRDIHFDTHYWARKVIENFPPPRPPKNNLREAFRYV